MSLRVSLRPLGAPGTTGGLIWCFRGTPKVTAHGDLCGFSPPGVALQKPHHEPWSSLLLSGLWTRAEIPGQLGTRLGDGRGRTHLDAGPGHQPHDGRKGTQTQTRTHSAAGVSVATWATCETTTHFRGCRGKKQSLHYKNSLEQMPEQTGNK